MVLTAYPVLSPATNSSCHRRQRINGRSKPGWVRTCLRQLDTSNGCQDHTALPYAATSTNPSTARVQPAEVLAEALKRRSSARCMIAHGKPPCDRNHAPDAAASTASLPAFVTIAKRPSCRGGMGRACRDDLPDDESEIFFAKGARTDKSLICPTGAKRNPWVAKAHRAVPTIYRPSIIQNSGHACALPTLRYALLLH